MAMVSPSATVWPTSAGTCHTLAAISASTSTATASPPWLSLPTGSDWQDAVLAPWPVDLLGAGDLQTLPDRGAGVGGVDDIVDQRVAGGDVRVDGAANLLRHVQPRLRALFALGDGFELLAIDDVDGPVGAHH